MFSDDLKFHIWPGWPFIFSYALSGFTAGVAQAPYEHFFQQRWRVEPQGGRWGHIKVPPPDMPYSSTVRTFAIHQAPTLLLSTTIRFAAFGQFKRIRDVKREMGTNTWPRWLDIAASGACASVVETVTVSRMLNPLGSFPSPIVLSRGALKLFGCFGMFGYLSTAEWAGGSQRGTPPEPFWKCWLMGATAGAFGSTVQAALTDGVRGRWLFGKVMVRGALSTGTLIAVHVTTCKWYLNELDV